MLPNEITLVDRVVGGYTTNQMAGLETFATYCVAEVVVNAGHVLLLMRRVLPNEITLVDRVVGG